jgi:chaperonin GroEL
VLVVADKITKVAQIAPILDLVKTKATNRPFLLICEDLQEEPMSTMVYNNSKDILTCCAINIPWLAGVQKEVLKDIAVMTGATIVDNEYVLKLEDVELKHFGTAKLINVDENFTNVVGGAYKQEALDQRI